MLNGCYATICGNAVADFELRFTPAGVAVGDVTVAVNSRVQVEGEWEDREDPMYVRCTVWREYAEHCAETIMQGDRLIVAGEMHVRGWEDRDGARRLAFEMTADEIGPSLRWAEAKVTRVGGGDDRRDDRDDDRGRGRGRDRDDDRGNRRGGRGRDSDDRGTSRDRRSSGRGSDSGRRGSSGRDDRGSRSRRDDDRGSSRGRSSKSVWDADERDDDPDSDLPAEPNY